MCGDRRGWRKVSAGKPQIRPDRVRRRGSGGLGCRIYQSVCGNLSLEFCAYMMASQVNRISQCWLVLLGDSLILIVGVHAQTVSIQAFPC